MDLLTFIDHNGVGCFLFALTLLYVCERVVVNFINRNKPPAPKCDCDCCDDEDEEEDED